MNTITIIVPCHNEADIIAAKVANCHNLNTGEFNVELAVVDDHSDDDTVVRAQAEGARVIRSKSPKGKWNAISYAAQHTSGHILCITDADAIVDADAILPALELFRDPKIGAVCGLRRMVRRDSSGKLTPYNSLYDVVRKMMLRLYSMIDSTPALHGPLMFVRRDMIAKIDCHLLADDVDIPIQLRKLSYKAKVCIQSRFTEIQPVAADRNAQALRRAIGLVQAYWHHRSVLFNKRLGAFGLIAYPLEFTFFLIAPFVALTILPAAAAATLFDDILAMLFLGGMAARETPLLLEGFPCITGIMTGIVKGIMSYVFNPGLDDILGMLFASGVVAEETTACITGSPGVRIKMSQMAGAILSYAVNPNFPDAAWKPPRRDRF